MLIRRRQRRGEEGGGGEEQHRHPAPLTHTLTAAPARGGGAGRQTDRQTEQKQGDQTALTLQTWREPHMELEGQEGDLTP